MNTTITWSQAQHVPGPEKNQQKYVDQFLSENHEMTDVRDLLFYHEQTGRSFEWLSVNARGIAPNIKAAVMMSEFTIDDIIDLQPHHPPILETPDRVLDAGTIHVMYDKFPQHIDGKDYAVMVSDDSQEIGWWYCTSEEDKFMTLEECKKIPDQDLINHFNKNLKQWLNQ